MILIFSEREDLTTRHVIRYLNNLDEPFEIFLEDDTIEFTYKIENGIYKYSVYKNNIHICEDREIKSVWTRRIDVKIKLLGGGVFEQETEVEYANWYNKARYEQIQRNFHNKKCLGVFGKGNFNKIEFLENCVSLGIEIPKTLITQSKLELIAFFNENQKGIITKSLGGPYVYTLFENNTHQHQKLGYTTEITNNHLDQIPDAFDLSLFQEKLDKKYEIRVFYINRKCFSTIIFSQSNHDSELDYRRGYGEKMRQCNYTLPNKIKEQVILLMTSINLNTGSLDIVVTKDNKYVFLEVNPSGQFGGVSEYSNANLEYEVVKYLTA